MSSSCLTCFKNLTQCFCPPPANDNKPWDPLKIGLPADCEIAKPSAVRRSALIYKAMGISRRGIPDFVNDRLMDYEGEIIDSHGLLICHLDIDVDHWFNLDSDPSYRWISRFLSFSEQVPIQSAQTRVVPRLILLWIAIAIGSRTQAELIIR